MAADFRKLADNLWVAPQIRPEDIPAAAAMGVTTVINNRPDKEEWGQPAGADIEAAAKAAGLDYVAIPVVNGVPFSPEQIDAFDAAVAGAKSGVLAFCRSGTRSTILRSLAAARAGVPVDLVIVDAKAAGYDMGCHRELFDSVALWGANKG